MRRRASIFEVNPDTGKEEYRIIFDPTIGDIRRLRSRGAIIFHEVIKRVGNTIYKKWITDDGIAIIESTEIKL